MNYQTRKDYYTKLWATVKVDYQESTVLTVAKKLLQSKARYEAVAKPLGVPWEVVAVIHQRESSGDFKTNLGQGDPLSRVSIHEPKGQGPFTGPTAWEQAAVLNLKLRRLDKVPGWEIERILWELECYNGLGYASHGRNSPYLWSHTNHYQDFAGEAGNDTQFAGKYVSDGHYDPGFHDPQIGCAALLVKLYSLSQPVAVGPVVASTKPDTTPTTVSNPWVTFFKSLLGK